MEKKDKLIYVYTHTHRNGAQENMAFSRDFFFLGKIQNC